MTINDQLIIDEEMQTYIEIVSSNVILDDYPIMKQT